MRWVRVAAGALVGAIVAVVLLIAVQPPGLDDGVACPLSVREVFVGADPVAPEFAADPELSPPRDECRAPAARRLGAVALSGAVSGIAAVGLVAAIARRRTEGGAAGRRSVTRSAAALLHVPLVLVGTTTAVAYGFVAWILVVTAWLAGVVLTLVAGVLALPSTRTRPAVGTLVLAALAAALVYLVLGYDALLAIDRIQPGFD